MNGIPDDFPHDSLVGATLLQVCIGEHDLQLGFDKGLHILITSSIRTGEVVEPIVDFRSHAEALCRLIGKTISASRQGGKAILALTVGDEILEIIDDSSQFESFVVRIGETEIVV